MSQVAYCLSHIVRITCSTLHVWGAVTHYSHPSHNPFCCHPHPSSTTPPTPPLSPGVVFTCLLCQKTMVCKGHYTYLTNHW